MTGLSRFGMGAALAIVLAAAPIARAAEPDKLLPADSEFVLSANFKQIVESEIVKKYALEQLKQFLQGNDAKKFLTDLGLDPLKDVERVVLGGSGNDQSDQKALLIIHGKFDPEKLFKSAEAQTKKDPDHFSLIKDGKDKMFKYQPDNGNPVYGTVVDETTVVAGTDKKLVARALGAGKKAALSKDLATLITRMDDKASLWMVGVVKGKLEKGKLPPNVPANIQGQLANLESFSAVVRVTADVALDVTIGMKDADSAEEVGKLIDEGLTQLKGAVPFLAAMNPQLKPLVEVTKSIKNTVKDKSVTISAKMSGSSIGELLNKGD